MKTDYTLEIKNLLRNNFEPVISPFDSGEYTEKKTLTDVYNLVIKVIPKDWVYESDLYEIMEELGFKSFLHTDPAEFSEDQEEIVEERSSLFYFMNKKTAAI